MTTVPVYLDETPWFGITVTPGQTIADLKKVFANNPDLRITIYINGQKFSKGDPIWGVDDVKIVATRTHIERIWTKDPNLDKMILMNFSPSELFNVCRTNNYLANLCRDKHFWRNKIARDFPLRGKFIYYEEYKQLYINNPRQLYETINSQSKIVTLLEDDYPELAELIPEETNFSEAMAGWITEAILPNLSKLPLLRGDVIFLEWLGEYRNTGKFLWDGEKVVNLDSEIDEYGSVPSDFTFPEFPLDHFFSSIDHNNIIWLSPQTIKELHQNYRAEISDENNDEIVGNVILSDIRASSVITDNFGTKYRIQIFADIPEEAIVIDEQIQEEVFERKYLDIDDATIETLQDGSKQFNTLIYVNTYKIINPDEFQRREYAVDLRTLHH